MKYRYIALLLGLLLALTACGESVASVSAEPAPEPETFGAVEIGSTPEQAAKTTDLPASDAGAPEATPEPETASFTEVSAEGPVEAENLDEEALLSGVSGGPQRRDCRGWPGEAHGGRIGCSGHGPVRSL